MSTTSAISGNTTKNDGGTILFGGAISDSTKWNSFALSTNTDPSDSYGSKVFEAVSPDASGNIGTFKPLSAGVFGSMETGQYVAKVIGTRIAQTDDTFLRSGAAETSTRQSLHFAKGNHRYDITSWDYVTGAATKGGNAGVLVTYIDPETGSSVSQEAYPTNAVPGKLVYLDGSLVPTQDTYKARTL